MSTSDTADDTDGEEDAEPQPRPKPEPPEDPIVETTTIENATVKIHAHPWQQPVDVITDTVDIQVLASSVSLNGNTFENPTRALTVENCRVTHDPREGSVEILTH